MSDKNPTDDDYDRLLLLLESGMSWDDWKLTALTVLGPDMFDVLRASMAEDGIQIGSWN